MGSTKVKPSETKHDITKKIEEEDGIFLPHQTLLCLSKSKKRKKAHKCILTYRRILVRFTFLLYEWQQVRMLL